MGITFQEENSKVVGTDILDSFPMKRYLPLLGVFLLFFLVISGFAYGQPKGSAQEFKVPASVNHVHATSGAAGDVA
ncbi:hypothetical protein EFA69_10985 [Rufibacter immobilis]|uniref:Uncharacterized protein n=2 Tax=Rufibacter immobilis TaxID=1348778 RepID=A0A3M9MWY2_9BACT|nr:hypothetical protein EFA69_10985 [Rufibacter immobilis]